MRKPDAYLITNLIFCMMYGGTKPDSISELRWRGMKSWYETRNKKNDWLDADYR